MYAPLYLSLLQYEKRLIHNKRNALVMRLLSVNNA